MAKTTLYVAAGHAPNAAPGAVYHGRNEAEEAVRLVDGAVKLAKPHLAKNHVIKKVSHHLDYVATVDEFNAKSGPLDLLIEVHYNAFADQSATGTETLYGHKATAQTLQNALVKVLKLPNRGVKHRTDLYVTTATDGGVIIEMGFISNKEDMKVIDKRGVLALATALVSLSHGKYKAIPKSSPKPEPKKYWRVRKNGKQVGAYSSPENAVKGYKTHKADKITDPNGKNVTKDLIKEGDMDKLRAKIVELEDKIKNILDQDNQTIGELQGAISEKQKEISELQDENADLRESHDQLAKDKLKLQKKLDNRKLNQLGEVLMIIVNKIGRN